MSKIDKLGWLCIRSKKLLVAKSIGKDIYYIPGGKREIGESDEDALIREIQEELSIHILPNTIKYIGQFQSKAHGKSDETVVKITCYSSEFVGEIQASAEIQEVSWLSYEDKESCSMVTKCIMDWLKSENLIE